MDLKQIEKLMAAMERARMHRVVIKTTEGFEIELEREGHPSVYSASLPPPSFPPPVASPFAAIEREASSQGTGVYVEAPMVGTFYTAPSPEDPPYVKVGDTVEPNTIVCIIEAMKVMNEVKAGVGGTLTEILLKNGQPVEFGTKIFRVEPK